MKLRLHFNRVNMQRGNKKVWTVHTSKGCYQAKEVVIMHHGEQILGTVFKPDGKQPRAYLEGYGKIYKTADGVLILETSE